MTRVDYLNDPNAPRANSIVVAVSAVIVNDAGEILMILRTDNNYWSIPGGALDPGETLEAAVKREIREETGMDCEVIRIVGVYSNPHHVAAYDDGEVRQEFSICFQAKLSGGSISTSEESSDVRFIHPDALVEYRIHPSIMLRIEHYLARLPDPHIG